MERLLTSVVIPAAGQGRRMNAPINKQYLMINGKPILAYTLDVFENCPLISEMILVINKDEFRQCRQQVLRPYHYKKIRLVEGGNTRQESVYKGLRAVNPKTDIVMIHDGARPIVQESVIIQSIYETLEYKATVVGVPAKNTIKMIDGEGFVKCTPNRDYLVEIQTPQTFEYELLKEAHEKAIEAGIEGTDDAFLVERLNYPVKIVTGHYTNIKITTPEDLIIAESIIKQLEKKDKQNKKTQ